MLLGADIKVHTDHKNLTYTSSVNDHVLRQLNYIERFGPEYLHIAGDDNFLADMFSRLHRLDDKFIPLDSSPKKRENSIENFSFLLDDNELLECFLNLPNTDDIPFALDLARIAQGQQNDKELWYMMDGSFITHMPDVWGLGEKFILLPINLWNNQFHKVNIGGLTCDSMDYYDSEAHLTEVFLPMKDEGQQLFFGFFHNGAYQESLGGYGGIQHCLIPAAKHILLKKDKEGNIHSELFAEEQTSESMLKILGYD